MKINGSNQINALNRYKKTVETQQAAVTNRTVKTDQVEISSEAKGLLESQSVKDTASASRSERIEQLKNAVQSGTYRVETSKLVDRLLPYLK